MSEAPLVNERSTLTKVKTQRKEPAGGKLLFSLMQFLGWVPLILLFTIGDTQLAFTIAFGVVCLNLALSLVYHKMGKTRSWPRILDIIFFCLFGSLTIMVWALPEDVGTIKIYTDVIIFGGMSLGMLLTKIIGKPFIKSFIEDEYDDVSISHPLVQHIIKRLTVLGIVAFGLMGLISLIPALNGEGNIICLVIVYAILVSFLLTAWFWYPAYAEKHAEEICTKYYPEETEEWEKAHPDHEFSQEV